MTSAPEGFLAAPQLQWQKLVRTVRQERKEVASATGRNAEAPLQAQRAGNRQTVHSRGATEPQASPTAPQPHPRHPAPPGVPPTSPTVGSCSPRPTMRMQSACRMQRWVQGVRVLSAW